MNMSRFAIGLAILLIALVALVTYAPSPAIALQTGATPAPAPQATALQVTQNATLGSFVTDNQGRTLYLFTKDTNTTSNCADTCATLWPPLQAQAQSMPSAMTGIDQTLIGSIQRSDGSTQLTYNGHPLYYYSKDMNAGDTNGQGVAGVWFAISPSGNPVQATAAPAAGMGLQVTQNTTIGNFVSDSQGRTLYIFMKDAKDTSNCADACATLWPPLQAQAQSMPSAMTGIDQTLIGSIQRSDGSMQVTYNGHPLYYYSKDMNAGDMNGQGLGGNWFVVSPSGDPVQASSAAPAPAAAATATPY